MRVKVAVSTNIFAQSSRENRMEYVSRQNRLRGAGELPADGLRLKAGRKRGTTPATPTCALCAYRSLAMGGGEILVSAWRLARRLSEIPTCDAGLFFVSNRAAITSSDFLQHPRERDQ